MKPWSVRFVHKVPSLLHLRRQIQVVSFTPCLGDLTCHSQFPRSLAPLLAPLSGATLVSTAQCLALSLEWEKKRNYKKLKKPLAQRAQTLFKMTLRP